MGGGGSHRTLLTGGTDCGTAQSEPPRGGGGRGAPPSLGALAASSTGRALWGRLQVGGHPQDPPSPGPLLLVPLITGLHGRGVVGLILGLIQLGVTAAAAAPAGGRSAGLILPLLLLLLPMHRAGTEGPVRLVAAGTRGRQHGHVGTGTP